jgi:translation initiation factor IF-2
MKQQPSAVIKKLFMKGIALTLNSELDYDKAEEIALEFNILCEHEKKVDVIEEMLKEEEEDPKDLKARPPVVCVMGHVDHGKTSLLDAIRDTRVTSREAGGITQKIGAYVVDVKGRKITFLDTPGHEAFTAMRMRGANSTDIAVLVVAADDGVMPQTVEAINHAKAAGVEIIVAVNKIDKPNANIDRVKQELAEYELIPEDWGGSTIFVPVSAKTHQGIDDLLEMILLTADVMELKANPDRAARGLIIEAQLDKGKGPVATVLVQKGTLHVGDCISAGSSYGKIRAMSDENGKRVKSAGPSMPVEVQGLSDVPNAGEIFVAHDNEKDARSFAQEFVNEEKEKLVEESRSRMSLDNLFNQVQSGKVKELDIIVKADVQGSVEAVRQSLEKLSNDEVVVRTIHGGVGSITESDVVLASASNAIIIGFNVRPDAVAKEISEREHVDIHLYNVIYNAIEDVESAMKGMLEPVYEEKVIGHAEVRQTFKASGIGIIAGSFVTDGVIERGCKIRLSRGKKQLADVDLLSLKRFKDDAKEVKEGYECGVVLKDFSDIQEGDVMEAYKMVEVPRS